MTSHAAIDQSDVTDASLEESKACQQPHGEGTTETGSWQDDPDNPINWSKGKKAIQLVVIGTSCFTSSVGTSLPSSATFQYRDEFGVSITQSILPVALYVFALGLGPVLAGPLSETVGRKPVYVGSMVLGTLFTLGAGLTNNFGALCFLRFMAGFCYSPSLAIAPGSVGDVWAMPDRALPTIIAILMPFLGPGFGPVIGSFLVVRKGWRWTQWVLMMFGGVSLLAAIIGQETYHPVLERRRAKKLGLPHEDKPPLGQQIAFFVRVSLLRPVHMLVAEPIVTLTCLYVACEFATLFGFFAGVPYVFSTVYGFSVEQQGLVFVAIIVGCLLGAVTIALCTRFLYAPRAAAFPPGRSPPELRLFPGIVGCFGPPVGLFLFGWTARESISWAAPAVAIVPFAWGNFCIFVCCMHYLTETYKGTVVASASSANSLARYTLAGLLPLFTVDMYRAMTTGWAASLLGFIAVALAPVPWALYRWGPLIRAKSKYETA